MVDGKLLLQGYATEGTPLPAEPSHPPGQGYVPPEPPPRRDPPFDAGKNRWALINARVVTAMLQEPK